MRRQPLSCVLGVQGLLLLRQRLQQQAIQRFQFPPDGGVIGAVVQVLLLRGGGYVQRQGGVNNHVLNNGAQVQRDMFEANKPLIQRLFV